MHAAKLSGIFTLILLGCAAAPPAPKTTPEVAPTPSASAASPEAAGPTLPERVVAAADRSQADRALDEGRKPAELLRFAKVGPGMRVLDLGAGGGYTAELLARAVAPGGVVYAENPKTLLGFVEKPWSERLATPPMKNVVRVDAELDAPWGPEVKDLDAVTIVLFYHDTVWLGADRTKMNAAVFAALKPGGAYVIVDHTAKDGDGVSVVKTLHRIEESVVKDEVQKAGFVLDEEGSFLRDPADTKDWNASPREAGEKRGHSDRFALRFKKP